MNQAKKTLSFPDHDAEPATREDPFAPTVLHPDGTAGISWAARMLRVSERDLLGLALDGEILIARYCYDSIKLAMQLKGLREREDILDYLMDVDVLYRNRIIWSFDRQSVKDYYAKNTSNNANVSKELGTEILQNTQVILERVDEIAKGMKAVMECCEGLKKLKEEVAEIKKKIG